MTLTTVGYGNIVVAQKSAQVFQCGMNGLLNLVAIGISRHKAPGLAFLMVVRGHSAPASEFG